MEKIKTCTAKIGKLKARKRVITNKIKDVHARKGIKPYIANKMSKDNSTSKIYLIL